MDESDLRDLLSSVQSGDLDVDQALVRLRMEPYEDLGFAKVDLQRGIRTGAAEVIYGAGKTADQIARIAKLMADRGQRTILITRLDEEKAQAVCKHMGLEWEAFSEENQSGQGLRAGKVRADKPGDQCGKGCRNSEDKALNSAGTCAESKDGTGHGTERGMQSEKMRFRYEKRGKIAVLGDLPKESGIGKILVLTAGTSDIPVAEEAAVTARALGNQVVRVYDAGVAGLHRLLAHMDEIMEATVIIAIAGMEGALPAVVTGLADCPVVAVPTSVGYGTAFHGVSALLSMLNCCASGMCVENIDNGFGAAYFASMINHLKGYRQSE